MLAEVGAERPLLVSTERWRELDLPAAERFYGVRPHVPADSVEAVVAALSRVERAERKPDARPAR